MNKDLIKREDAIKAIKQWRDNDGSLFDVGLNQAIREIKRLPSADRPQGEFTKREYEQFLHGISLSLLSKRSAQHWGYEEETAQKIRWLEALEQKVRAKMKGADDEF